ncbi:VirB4 family type IV secretion/conjugal transfer ATPase [Pseudoalteromonas sp. Of11M-6]|uniref:VirB4 family type IV secretion/conjugal transfer ATPase n=2 Tax=Pseudoalteromonas TaxID=53246 RepID=UPI001EF4123E|nr:VirB4 family type IV secretion/conjugal transfer ATPase [Pseudoalteromonas sp. Of11M-6]MCG7556246.1 VirB4 family type IV secretion/conjugal transfer ATPase [Pseudoalteromonas sp. Of11M-6]
MSEIITLLTVTICLILIVLLASKLFQFDKDKRLDKYRKKQAGLVDLLNYAAVVDDGIIVNKNGSFTASWLYTGDDNASSTDQQRELVSLRINQAFAGKLGNGWMIHVDAVRKETPKYSNEGSHFPDRITHAIDLERERFFAGQGNVYEGFFVLSVTFYPPILAQTKFIELMFDDDSEKLSKNERTHGLIEQFKSDCKRIESSLSSGLKLIRLKGVKVANEDGDTVIQDDQLRYLQYCVTGKNHPVNLPNTALYIDQLIGSEEFYSGTIPKVGRKFIQTVSIDGLPLNSAPGILSRLAELPIEYRWSSRFIFMEQHESLALLKSYRKKWKQKVRGFFSQVFNTNNGQIDQDAVDMVADADAAMAEVNSNLVAMGYYTSVVVLMSENREQLTNAAEFVEKSINDIGFSARIETVNTVEAYLGSLPSHGVENVRRPLINTMNLADLIPTSTLWTGNAKAPCPFYPDQSPPLMHCLTAGNAPFRLNLHVRDVGHTIMFGPTGAGKSTHLGLLAASFRRYKDISIFAFDKGMSMFPLVKAAGGSHFSVGGGDDSLNFCPLQYLDSKHDRAWAMEWIDSILALNGVETTPKQRNEIGSALVSMSETGSQTMTDFVSSIQDKTIREALKQYTIEGLMGHLLDATEDGLSFNKFTVFEIEELMDLGDKYALPVLLYLFRRIEKSLTGQPAVIFLDEAWLMLAHGVFKDKIKEWLKVLRKANCIVVMATQSLSDAANSGILDVITESTASKIFLPNAQAKEEETAKIYSRMGLNPRQIDIISKATPKRQYYYVSEQGRRLYDLAIGPITMAFVGKSDKDTISLIKDLEAAHGERWVDEYLSKQGLLLNTARAAA